MSSGRAKWLGNEVGVDRQMQQAQALAQVVLPELRVPLEQKLAAPDVVDQDVQPPGVALDPRHQPGHLGWFQMVNGDRGRCAPGLRHQVGGLLDGLGPPVLRLVMAGRTARDVNMRPGGTELNGDSPPRAACAASHQRHLARQDAHVGLPDL